MKRALLPVGALLLISCGAGSFLNLPVGKMAEASRALKGFQKQTGAANYYVSGNSEAEVTFLFVHGTPGAAENWGAFLTDPELAANFRLLAFDRLGFGDSEGKAVPQLAQQAAALAAEAEKIPGRKLWVGHSYGVPVIARLAADRPDLIDGAVWIAGPAGPQYVKKTWYQTLAATDLGQAVISQDLKTANLEMLALETELEILQPAWERMAFPITVIHAKDDILAKFGNVSFLKEQLPEKHLRLRELEKGNHFLVWSHRELVLEEMRRLANRTVENKE